MTSVKQSQHHTSTVAGALGVTVNAEEESMEYYYGQGAMILFATWALVEMFRFFIREARALARNRSRHG